MIRKILISINPQHVAKILSGEKKYEYRTRLAKDPVSSMLIYETSPMKKIVAEVEILGTTTLPVDTLWRQTESSSGLDEKTYHQYFKGRSSASAYILGDVTIFEEPIDISQFGLTHAPQSFYYIDVK